VIDPLAESGDGAKKAPKRSILSSFNGFTSGRSHHERKPATIFLVSFRPKLTLLELKRRKI
jgi:hypothetical protein